MAKNYRPLDKDSNLVGPLFKALNNLPKGVLASQIVKPEFSCVAYREDDDHGVVVSPGSTGNATKLAKVWSDENGPMFVEMLDCDQATFSRILAAVRSCTTLQVIEYKRPIAK